MLYPIGIQNFEKIRKDGYVYVDKTDYIFQMAQKGGYYFLSRPRRFGKSLLVSTMEAYFSGKKELFEGLAVAGLEKNWIQYPVLRFDLTGKSYTSVEDLNQYLDAQLTALENRFEAVKLSESVDIRFQQVIEAAYNKTGHPAVILIDEYDKPIVDNLGNDSLSDMFRKKLQGFYSVMKTKDEYIRFGFLTGVTKIGKLSIFSGLNNLKDISMDSRFAGICGIGKEDIDKYFGESIDELAEANGLTKDETSIQLAQMYDGYHFCEDSDGIYNPFSVLNTFESLKFREYWFETGTPSFLIKIMKETS
ncbi:MAG: AAA family ATPase, partial [Candidatus Cryptobacteroides sp.]